jgi:hypothetical protein
VRISSCLILLILVRYTRESERSSDGFIGRV